MAKTKWYASGLGFECTRCGNCCSGPPGYVWVTKAEIEAIAKFLGRTDGTLDRTHLRRVALRRSLTERPGGDCIFLERDGKRAGCSIHPVRPKQCRTWPFWNENLRTDEAWNMAARNCPGMNHGPHHGFVAIEDLRRGRTDQAS